MYVYRNHGRDRQLNIESNPSHILSINHEKKKKLAVNLLVLKYQITYKVENFYFNAF